MKKSRKIVSYILNYRLHSLFFKNFLISLTLIIIPLIIVMAIAIKSNKRIIESEMENIIRINLTNTQTLLDRVIKDINYIAGSLSLDINLRQYLFSRGTDKFTSDTNVRDLIKTLASLTARNNPISSIYIYSELHEEVITSQRAIHLDQFEDKNWMEKYKEMETGQPVQFSRNMFKFTFTDYDESPNNITVMKPVMRLNKEDSYGAIIINLEHARLTEHIISSEIEGEIFILQAEGEILYSLDRNQIQKNINDIYDKIELPRKDHAAKIDVRISLDYITAMVESQETNLFYLLKLPLTHYKDQQKRLAALSFLLTFFSILAALFASLLLSWNSYLPIKNLLNVLENPEEARLNRKGQDETKFIANNIIRNLNTNAALKSEIKDQLSLLDHTKTAALQAQINPHFLYNTLESIRWGAIDLTGNENKVSLMISDLAKLLRLSLETEDNTSSLETEVTHACMFIRLLKARYPDKLTVNWDIDEDLNSCTILKLCLQPLIENAFYHGVKPTRKMGVIDICGRKSGSILVIEINDNGKGMKEKDLMDLQEKLKEKSPLQEDHIGIRNVHQRIQLIFGEEYGLEVRSHENRGTTITLSFPFRELPGLVAEHNID